MRDRYFNEKGYETALENVWCHGYDMPDRTGVGCRKLYGISMKFTEPFQFSTTRPMGIRNAWEEMRLFLSGDTNTKTLEDKGINFWKGNTSREFLDSRGLQHLPEGSLGKSYSYQWRNAGGSVDQLERLWSGLKNDPYSRRHCVDLWGVSEQHEMPLLPCWYRSDYHVDGKNRLHVKLHSRSCDLLFGFWQAVYQYRLFQMALCEGLGFTLGDLQLDMGDIHIYHNQIDYVKELLLRTPGTNGSVKITSQITSLDDIVNLNVDDFEVIGYEPNRKPFKTPRPAMAV